MLEGGDGADLFSDELDKLFLYILGGDIGLEHNETNRHLPLQFLNLGNNRSLTNLLMSYQDLLHLGRTKSMSSSIDNIIQPSHNIQIAIIVIIASISSGIVTGSLGHVFL